MKAAITGVVVAMLSMSVSAHADDFYFSFRGDLSHPGYVIGEVFGLENNNSSSSATRLDITSSSITGLSAEDFSVLGLNAFGEEGGAVTQANFAGDSSSGDSLTLDVGDGSALNHGAAEVSYSGGFSGLTFTPAISAAPEPATWLFMFAGLAGIGIMLRRVRKGLIPRVEASF